MRTIARATAVGICLLAPSFSVAAQDPAPVAPKPEAKRPNAADLYLTAVATLPATLGVESEFDIQLPEVLGDDERARRYEEKGWDEMATKVASELGLFAQAAHTVECAFAPEPDGWLVCDTKIVPLYSLVQITAANGFLRLRKKSFDAALHDASTLLASSRQFGHQPSTSAMALGSQVELSGLALLRAVLEVEDALEPSTRKKAADLLEHHARTRPGRRAAAAGIRTEVHRLLSGLAEKTNATSAEAGTGLDAEQRLLRDNLAAVSQRVDERLEHWLAPLVAQDDVPIADLLTRVDANLKAARAKVADLKALTKKKDRTEAQVLDVLADSFVTLLLANPKAIVQNDAYSRDEIATCRRLVAADRPDDGK